MSSSVSFSEYLRLTRENRNFRKLWFAQIVSEIGDWFYTLAIYSLLLNLTGRASSVALALVLQVLPQTFVGPLAGAINDRLSRRRVMIFADLMRMLIVGSMLLVRSARFVWVVYPLLLLETVMAAFFEPARNSIIPSITAEEDVIVANTLASATWSFNLAIGALMGGAVAALFGRDAVFVLNALSFLVSAVLIGRGPPRGGGPGQNSRALRLFPHCRRPPLYLAQSETAGHGFPERRRRHSGYSVGVVSRARPAGPVVAFCHLARARRAVWHEPADGRARTGGAHRTATGVALGRTPAAATTERHISRLPARRHWLRVPRAYS